MLPLVLYAITYTDAPPEYDGFGTKTLKVVGKRRGADVRQVATPTVHLDWQRNRYASGCRIAMGEDDWAAARHLLLDPEAT